MSADRTVRVRYRQRISIKSEVTSSDFGASLAMMTAHTIERKAPPPANATGFGPRDREQDKADYGADNERRTVGSERKSKSRSIVKRPRCDLPVRRLFNRRSDTRETDSHGSGLHGPRPSDHGDRRH